MWHWSLLSRVERERHELQSACTRRCQAPGPGRRDVQCLVQDQLSTTTKRVVALKTCASAKLFRGRSGVVMTSSAWVLARRGRCGSCMVLMTKKAAFGESLHCVQVWPHAAPLFTNDALKNTNSQTVSRDFGFALYRKLSKIRKKTSHTWSVLL